jgi:hypothetical protein
MEFHRGELPEPEREAERERLKSLRRPPVVLDANVDAILRALDQAEKSNA